MICWRRKWQSTPVLLPGKSHGQRSLVGYRPWGRKESDMTSLSRSCQYHSFDDYSSVVNFETRMHGFWNFHFCRLRRLFGPLEIPCEFEDWLFIFAQRLLEFSYGFHWIYRLLWVVLVLVAQSCPTLCDPMDCSLPGSSVHGIFQAIVLEWIAISFSSGWIFLTQESNPGLPHCRQALNCLNHQAYKHLDHSTVFTW